ncbi:MAG TPA: hypothetical protein VHG30_06600 [Microvirga sp.]|nr:hypothetical protein [Microvirga sp.]
MILLMFATLIGAAITVAVLWPHGVLVMLLGAPFGGSFLALVAGGYLALRGTARDEESRGATLQSTKEMVTALKRTHEQLARQSGDAQPATTALADAQRARRAAGIL